MREIERIILSNYRAPLSVDQPGLPQLKNRVHERISVTIKCSFFHNERKEAILSARS